MGIAKSYNSDTDISIEFTDGEDNQERSVVFSDVFIERSPTTDETYVYIVAETISSKESKRVISVIILDKKLHLIQRFDKEVNFVIGNYQMIRLLKSRENQIYISEYKSHQLVDILKIDLK